MRAETRENSLEIWEVQRQSSVLTKSIGEDAPVTKIIEQQTADLAERNEKLSQGILAGINGVRELICCMCYSLHLLQLLPKRKANAILSNTAKTPQTCSRLSMLPICSNL